MDKKEYRIVQFGIDLVLTSGFIESSKWRGGSVRCASATHHQPRSALDGYPSQPAGPAPAPAGSSLRCRNITFFRANFSAITLLKNAPRMLMASTLPTGNYIAHASAQPFCSIRRLILHPWSGDLAKPVCSSAPGLTIMGLKWESSNDRKQSTASHPHCGAR